MVLSLLTLYLFGCACLAVGFGAFALAKGKTVLIRVFAILCFGASLYILGYAMEINCAEADRIMFWGMTQYFFLPFYPTLWLILTLIFIKALPTLRNPVVPLLFIVPIITFVLRLTDRYHDWYYTTSELTANPFFTTVNLGKGPWYYVQSVYIVLCFIAAIVVSGLQYHRLSPLRRRALRFILAAAVMPLVGLALIFINPSSLGLDYTPFLTSISLLIFLQALLRYDFLGVSTLAREMIIEISSDPMIVMDEERLLMDRNAAALALFPQLSGHRNGTSIATLFKDWPLILYVLGSPPDNAGKPPVLETDSGRFYEIEHFSIFDKCGYAAGYLIRLHDCTGAKLEEARLERRAATDELTGLANRRSFMGKAREELSQAEREKTGFSLLMIDIDHFKSVNDSFGHAAGDEALVQMAEALRATFRLDDFVARIGGEEFAVLLPGADRNAAVAAAEKFRVRVAGTTIPYENHSIRLTVSIGISTYRPEFASVEALMKEADHFLYLAKRQGRNRTTAADDPPSLNGHNS